MPEPDDLPSFVDLYWLPLGAGGHCVRLSGRAFEGVVARIERRRMRDLYHSALIVRLPEGTYAIEQGPAWNLDGERGVVCEGAVGSARLGRFRQFRYELRCWREGVIPDLAEAVESPQRITADPRIGRRILELAPAVPRLVWGRDQLQVGEMWNSNSVISWLIVRSGAPIEAVHLPANGRAPGWNAGVVVAGSKHPVPS
jgi:hypothetical protein